jgi:hypothetical protein
MAIILATWFHHHHHHRHQYAAGTLFIPVEQDATGQNSEKTKHDTERDQTQLCF